MKEIYNVSNEKMNNTLTNFVQNKKIKTKKVMFISKPKTKHIKINKDEINKIKKSVMGTELIKFRKKINKHFKSEDLNLLNNNIKSLKIKIKYFAPEILLLKFASGKYNLKRNKIVLIKYFKKDSTNHELFHMATSFYDKNLQIGFCGFQQIIFLKKETIGYGLNEGYTELLANRYFNECTNFSNYSYDVCTFFASKLEEIIEKNRMESFYMTADLFGLYKYLLIFDAEENIVNFIILLDSLIPKASSFNLNKFQTHYELIQLYLAKWYIKKKNNELEQNIIDENTFNMQIDTYINSLSNEELHLENYIKQKEYFLK